MKILVYEPDKPFEVVEIDGSLKSMQDIVGGLIQVVPIGREKTVLVCNEEGLLHGLDMNKFGIAGTFFFVGSEPPEFVSIDDHEIEIIKIIVGA